MASVASTFKTHEPSLPELLDEIHKGAVQLPDFQRGWVWDDDRIRALIASVSLSYPIGAVMLLETGGDGLRFKPRPVEGVPQPGPAGPQRLILDGQQRLTSLYLALRSGKPVDTQTVKKEPIKRVYFLDIARCLDPECDRLDAVVSLPHDRIVRGDFNRRIDLDVSTDEGAFEAGLFPLDIVFDWEKSAAWQEGYSEHFGYDPAKVRPYHKFASTVLQRFHQYRVPLIELLQDTPKEAVCQVFENVNTGGVALTVFELLTAIYAADNFELRKDWEARATRLRGKHRPLREVESSDFLMAATLLATYRRKQIDGQTPVSCKRKDVLRLTLDEYRAHAGEIEKGLLAAAKLLAREKIFDNSALPYVAQLIPLAATCAVLGPRSEEDPIKRKLCRWYWCGVFGELYGGANEGRFANDIQEVLAWVEGGEEPRTVRESNFAPARLLTLQTRLSAAYKGLIALLMQAGSLDFLNGDPIELTTYFDLNVDIHHIFPKTYCERQGYDRQRWNSVVNKAPLTSRTNRIIGGKAPSDYLRSLEKNHRVDPERLDSILLSHLISPDLLRADDFDRFYQGRARRLLDLIEDATGKPILGRDSDEVIQTFGGPLARS
jgi:hypothetical protein